MPVLGVIGGGRWSKVYLQTIERLPGFELGWVCAHRTDDWKAALARTPVDGVVVAVGPEAQPAIVQALIERRVAVIAEKPFALSIEAARAVYQAWKAADSLIYVDHIHLFQPSYRALKAGIRANGEKILRIRSAGGNIGPFRNYSSLWDYGPHDLSLCLDLLGTSPIRSEIKRNVGVPIDDNCPESFEIRLEFGAGVEAEIRVGNGISPKVRRFEVDTDQATWILDDLATPKLLRGEQAVSYAATAPLEQLLTDFASCDPTYAGLDLTLAITEFLAKLDSRS
jgi:predicted dehydrogenase